MARSIKLKDNNYLDSTSIVHNRINLADILNGTDSIFKLQIMKQSLTVEANAFVNITMGKLNTPNGYTYVGVIPNSNGYGDQWLVSYGSYSGNIVAMVHSKYPAALSAGLTCLAVFIKSDYYNKILI